MSSSMSGFGGMQSGAGISGNKLPKEYRQGQIQNFTPEQMQLFQQMFSHVGPESFLSRLAGGDQSMFAEMEAPAMRQFSALQGNIASRFSQPGMGARKSSGFQNYMGAQASNFAQDLQSQRLGLQQDAIKQLMNMSSNLLQQKPYDQFVSKKQPKKKSFWEQALGLVSPVGGDIASGGTENMQNFFDALQMFM